MKKQEYLNKVSEIYDTLVEAITDYNDGRIGIEEMQKIVRKCWDETPKEYNLIDEELAESLDLGEEMVGQVIRVDDYFPCDLECYKEWVEEFLKDFPKLKENPSGRFSVLGSNSLIPVIIGEPEWYYFAVGRKF